MGLLRKSYVPPAEVRQVRELTRARVHRVEDRVRVTNALHRLLERVGLKLCSVLTDLTGKTALAILSALAAGKTDPIALANLARESGRGKRDELAAVLSMSLTPIERMLARQHLDALALCEAQIAHLETEIRTATSLAACDRSALPRTRHRLDGGHRNRGRTWPHCRSFRPTRESGCLGRARSGPARERRQAEAGRHAPGQRLLAPDHGAGRDGAESHEERQRRHRLLPPETPRPRLQEGGRGHGAQAPLRRG